MTDCATCGAHVAAGAHFCGNCGTAVPVAPTPPPPPQPYPPAGDANATVVIPPQAGAASPPPGGYGPGPAAPAPGYPPQDPGYAPQAGAPGYPQATAPGGYPPQGPAPGYPPQGPPPGYPPSGPPPAGHQAPGYPPGGGPPPGYPPGAGHGPPSGGGKSKSKTVLLVVVGAIVVLGVIAAGVLVVPQIVEDDGDGSQAVEHVGGLPIDSEGPSSAPEEAWKKSIECDADEFECSIAADDDRVYVAVPGEGSSEVTAYAAQSGEEVWTKSVDDLSFVYWIEAGLIGLTDDKVLLLDPETGDQRYSVDGNLTNFHGDDLIVRDADEDTVSSRLVDVETGDELWDVKGQLISCGSSLAASNEDEVSLRDAESGDEQWNHDIDSGFADGQVWCSDEILAFPAKEGEIGVVATSDGSERGTIEVNFDDRRETFVRDDVVYIVDNNDLIAYSASGSSPEQLWKADWTDEVDDAFYVGEGVLLIDTGESAEVFAFDDGSSQAKSSLSYEEYFPTTDDIIVFDNESVAAFGPDELDELWKIDVDGAQDAVAAGSRLFILSADEIVAYE